MVCATIWLIMSQHSKTLSASVPEPVYRRAREIARQEQRQQSAVVADALRLYASLTPAARLVMENLAEQYGPRALDKLQAELSRALLRAQWEALADQTARKLPSELTKLSDDDVMRTVDEEAAATGRDRAATRSRR